MGKTIHLEEGVGKRDRDGIRRLAKRQGFALPSKFYAKTSNSQFNPPFGPFCRRLRGEGSRGSPFCGGGGQGD